MSVFRRLITSTRNDKDPYFSNVVFLLNASGADGSTTFTPTVSPAGIAVSGDPKIKTTLGYPAIYLDGNDYLKINYGSAFEWGSSDFTIELFALITTTSGVMGVQGGSFGGYYAFRLDYGGWYVIVGSLQRLNLTTSLVTGGMSHIALQRRGTVIEAFKGGVLQSTITVGTSSFSYTTNQIYLGCYVSGEYSSFYTPAIRITKGVARYSGNGPSPTFPFLTN